MNSRTVTELLDELAHVVRAHQFGLIQLTGNLTGWRTHRSGFATGELTTGQPPEARLRVVANRHAATAVLGELADAKRAPTEPGPVIVHGHLTIDHRWGVQFDVLRLRCAHQQETAEAAADGANRSRPWPASIRTVGLIAPDGGDDARDDIVASLADTQLTIIEHRVPVTGTRAVLAITHALDRLALDPRPDVTLLVRGGGPAADFVIFDSPLVLAAIGRHPRPVVTGLGHANNHTEADLVAHTTCITPTAAAQALLDVLAGDRQRPARRARGM